jgi:hypothetical protein
MTRQKAGTVFYWALVFSLYRLAGVLEVARKPVRCAHIGLSLLLACTAETVFLIAKLVQTNGPSKH